MAKKRKCRMSPEELAVHEQAVRLRRMSDKQLIEAFHRAAEPSSIAPQRRQDGAEDTTAVEKLLNALAEGKCKGIKGGNAYKVSQLAVEMGLV